MRWLAQGHKVTSFQRHYSTDLERLGVKQILGVLNDKSQVFEALIGEDAVLHNAAKASGWGAWHDFYQTNVIGTQNIYRRLLAIRHSQPGVYLNAERSASRPYRGCRRQ